MYYTKTPQNVLLRGTIANRTYGIHKNLYIYPFLLTIFGPIDYGPPVIERQIRIYLSRFYNMSIIYLFINDLSR